MVGFDIDYHASSEFHPVPRLCQSKIRRNSCKSRCSQPGCLERVAGVIVRASTGKTAFVQVHVGMVLLKGEMKGEAAIVVVEQVGAEGGVVGIADIQLPARR